MSEQPMVFDAPGANEALEAPSGGVPEAPEYGTAVPAPDPDDPALWPRGAYFEYRGERFRVADQVGLMALMDFAEIADQGVDSNAMAGLVAMKQLLRELVDSRDWDRFHKWARAERIEGDEFGEIVQLAMAVVDARPTGSPSASRGGRPSTGPSSNGTSGGPASLTDAYTARRRALGIVPIEEDLGG